MARIKPGWYVLVFLLLYGLVMTLLLSRSNAALHQARLQTAQAEEVQKKTVAAPAGLWLPLPGARLPQDAAHLPGAPKAYRQGVNQGFDFYDGDSGVPVPYGAPVIASTAGTLVRVDNSYQEPTPAEWQALLKAVAHGATEEQLDVLRGRQIWLKTTDGKTLRYALLSGIRPGLKVGQQVYRGEVIGYVGNSGTADGVAGNHQGQRLHFEIWLPDGAFFGKGASPEEVRAKAATLFVGP